MSRSVILHYWHADFYSFLHVEQLASLMLSCICKYHILVLFFYKHNINKYLRHRPRYYAQTLGIILFLSALNYANYVLGGAFLLPSIAIVMVKT